MFVLQICFLGQFNRFQHVLGVGQLRGGRPQNNKVKVAITAPEPLGLRDNFFLLVLVLSYIADVDRSFLAVYYKQTVEIEQIPGDLKPRNPAFSQQIEPLARGQNQTSNSLLSLRNKLCINTTESSIFQYFSVRSSDQCTYTDNPPPQHFLLQKERNFLFLFFSLFLKMTKNLLSESNGTLLLLLLFLYTDGYIFTTQKAVSPNSKGSLLAYIRYGRVLRLTLLS